MSPVISRTLLPRLARLSFRVPRRHAHDGFAALNVYKDASAAPQELPDDQYPDWLWRIQDPLPTKAELLREASAHFDRGGYDAVFEHMSENDLKRMFRLEARDKIRTENDRRRGGKVV